MAGWRELKRQMRRDVQDTFLVPAIYLASHSGATPKAVNVRLHVRFNSDEWEGESGLAAMLSETPKIRFDRREIDIPSGRAIVAVSQDEMYIVDAAEPPDDTFIYATVSQMPVADARAKPFAQWDADKTPAINTDYDKIITGVSE